MRAMLQAQSGRKKFYTQLNLMKPYSIVQPGKNKVWYSPYQPVTGSPYIYIYIFLFKRQPVNPFFGTCFAFCSLHSGDASRPDTHPCPGKSGPREVNHVGFDANRETNPSFDNPISRYDIGLFQNYVWMFRNMQVYYIWNSSLANLAQSIIPPSPAWQNCPRVLSLQTQKFEPSIPVSHGQRKIIFAKPPMYVFRDGASKHPDTIRPCLMLGKIIHQGGQTKFTIFIGNLEGHLSPWLVWHHQILPKKHVCKELNTPEN